MADLAQPIPASVIIETILAVVAVSLIAVWLVRRAVPKA